MNESKRSEAEVCEAVAGIRNMKCYKLVERQTIQFIMFIHMHIEPEHTHTHTETSSHACSVDCDCVVCKVNGQITTQRTKNMPKTKLCPSSTCRYAASLTVFFFESHISPVLIFFARAFLLASALETSATAIVVVRHFYEFSIACIYKSLFSHFLLLLKLVLRSLA